MNIDQAWQSYKTLGEQASAAQSYPYAEAMWAMATLIAEEFGEKDTRLTLSLDSLSYALLKQQKYSLAERFLIKCWRLKTKVQGATQLELTRTLNIISEVYYHQGKFVDAEQLCRKILQIYEQAYGREHPDTVTAARNVQLLEEVIRKMTPAPPPSAVPQAHVTGTAMPAVAPPATQTVHPQVGPGVMPPGDQTVAPQVSHALAPQQAVPPRMPQAVPPPVRQSGQLPDTQAPPPPSAQPAQPPQPVAAAPKPIAPSRAQLAAPEICEKCGRLLEGGECMRCTSTNIRALRMDERLT